METGQHARPSIVIVGIDYSDTGAHALEHAFEIASREGAEPHVVHVMRGFEWMDGMSYERAKHELHEYVCSKTRDFSERNGPLGFNRVCAHQRVGSAAEEIVALARDLAADVVVVGTHGRTGMSHVILGSVAAEVVRFAPCSVVVARPKQLAHAPVIEPPCPRCIEARLEGGGEELWCERHRHANGGRHTFHHVAR